MIVRIASEGQYEVPEEKCDRLNEIDNAAVAAVEAGNPEEFHRLWDEMIAFIKSEGTPLADDELVGSDVILPPPDITFEEASADFTGEGLIPD